MDNSSYNSLTEKLIQSGIISSDAIENIPDESISNFVNEEENYFEADLEEKSQDNPFKNTKKRLNQYDLDFLGNGMKNNKTPANILFKIFPKLYKAKLAKEALHKLDELGIDTKSLLDKTIPYGEGEIRYKNLVKFLCYANEMQSKIKDE